MLFISFLLHSAFPLYPQASSHWLSEPHSSTTAFFFLNAMNGTQGCIYTLLLSYTGSPSYLMEIVDAVE
jgi:hypothetical protein